MLKNSDLNSVTVYSWGYSDGSDGVEGKPAWMRDGGDVAGKA